MPARGSKVNVDEGRYIYVVCLYAGPWVKVGVTNNLSRRTQQFKNAHPDKPFYLAHAGRMPSKTAELHEKRIHQKLAAHKITHEMFWPESLPGILEYLEGLKVDFKGYKYTVIDSSIEKMRSVDHVVIPTSYRKEEQLPYREFEC